MIVEVGKDVRLAETDDMKSFKIASFTPDLEVVVQQLEKAGYRPSLDGERVWLSIARLREEITPDERAGFDGMIDYARGLNFVSPDGEHVRAHVEAVPGEVGSDRA